jgi:ribosomal protein S18 acetylase RimI-like enzyme
MKRIDFDCKSSDRSIPEFDCEPCKRFMRYALPVEQGTVTSLKIDRLRSLQGTTQRLHHNGFVSMPLTLHPIAAAEFEGFFAHFRERYIAERMEADRFTRGEAEEFVAVQHQAILPLGAATPGHELLWAFDSAGQRVGLVWLYVNGVMRQAFLYQIEVFEPFRRRGLGRELLAAAEELAKSKGARSIVLNVFDTNQPAIGLYQAAGFTTVSHSMCKPLN